MSIVITIAAIVLIGILFRCAAFYFSSKRKRKERMDEVKHRISANLD